AHVPCAMSVEGVPPSTGGGGGFTTVHVPWSWPGGTMHVTPVQQSAVVVQTPPAGTHIEPQCRWPIESGTHGARLQQSLASAHAPPSGTHELPQRCPLGQFDATGSEQMPTPGWAGSGVQTTRPAPGMLPMTVGSPPQ